MPLGVSSFQIRVRKDTTKSESDMPSKRRLSSMGGDAACAALAAALDFLEDFLEALGDSVGGVADSGAVSGGGVSGADSPSPWGGGGRPSLLVM